MRNGKYMNSKTNSAAENFISEGLLKLERLDFLNRLYKKDATVWKKEEEHTKIIDNSLGWLTVYDWTLERIEEVEHFAHEIKGHFTHVVVMGMGGSSLAPEVFRVIFGKQKDCPELIILDSTNADWVGDVRKKIHIEKTLFIFASKSGGTVEPSSQFAYFHAEMAKVSKEPGKHFIAITDPGTGLEKLAKDHKFRKIFINRADIGGRFSALSLFGIVPAALMGVNVKKVLESAKNFAEKYVIDVPFKKNTAMRLGALMGIAAQENKDKVILIMPKEIDVFGLWIEQLVAESSGKEGKGIVPVACEGVKESSDYKNDRVFVCTEYDCDGNDAALKLAEDLNPTGHPVFETEMDELEDIGAQFLLWEIATAAACALLGVDPFDQPNVQEAKTMAKGILDSLSKGKIDPAATAPLLLSKTLKGQVELKTLPQDLYSLVESNDYIALLPFINNSPEAEKLMVSLREKILAKTTRSVQFGYGPRYLHSTGQLHKGGNNNGVFVIFSADADSDIQIPGQNYSFADLANAQALGDFKALEAKGRRVMKIHLSKPALESLAKIVALF